MLMLFHCEPICEYVYVNVYLHANARYCGSVCAASSGGYTCVCECAYVNVYLHADARYCGSVRAASSGEYTFVHANVSM
jgi:hypothetical protein